MKAPVFRGVGKPLSIETIPDPTPGPGELVLRIGRCGICGSDLHWTSGNGTTYPDGSVIGHEFAGEVVAVGRGVEHRFEGDRVTALAIHSCGQCAKCLSGNPMWCERRQPTAAGGGGQYAIVKGHTSIRLPNCLSLADGALVEPLAGALHAVKLSGLSAGARVLVLGGGPVGIATCFWAHRLGATRVIISSRSSRNERQALAVGANRLMTIDTLSDQLDAALGGPPDIVFECVGAPGVLARAIDLVRPQGVVMVAGVCLLPDTFHPYQIFSKEIRIQGSLGFNLQEFQTAIDVLDRGAVEPRTMITKTVSLAELPDAFEALRNPTNQCKVMIDPWA